MSTMYQRLHKRILYPLWTTKDGNNPFDYLKQFEKSQYYPAHRVEREQLKKLKALVGHAYDKCPHYRRTWREAGFHPDGLRTLDDMARIPLLSKRDIQKHGAEMIDRDADRSRLVRNNTGGSTGEPLVFYLDRERERSRAASTIRHNRWAGLDVGDMAGSIWGHHHEIASYGARMWDRLKTKWIYRMTTLDTSCLDDAAIRKFVKNMQRDKPKVLVAYSNSMFLLACYVREYGLPLGHRPEAIICTAEMLTEQRREEIEKVFGCPVYNRYGCRETSIIASECEKRNGMHVNAEGVYVEVVRDNRRVRPGELGEVVVTDLLNTAMPLIRYRIKDVATPVAGRCECGRGLPRIELKGGRVTDFLVTPTGQMVSGASLTIFLTANAPGVQQMQIYQDKPWRVLFRVVRGPGYDSSSDDYIRMTARKFLGKYVECGIEHVPAIPLSPSGKHLYCISEIHPFG